MLIKSAEIRLNDDFLIKEPTQIINSSMSIIHITAWSVKNRP